MNKRIWELFKQSGIDIGEDQESNIEKFAELIIQECVTVVNLWSDEVPCSEGYDIFTVGKLKEHFGIKE